MQRPPRRSTDRLFSRRTVVFSILQGLSVLAVSIGVFLYAARNHTEDASRALTFATLVVAFVAVILVNRSWSRSFISMVNVPNVAMRWVILGTAALLVVVLTAPPVQRVFHFAPLHIMDLGFSLGAGLVCVLWFELFKRHWRRTRDTKEVRAV